MSFHEMFEVFSLRTPHQQYKWMTCHFPSVTFWQAWLVKVNETWHRGETEALSTPRGAGENNLTAQQGEMFQHWHRITPHHVKWMVIVVWINLSFHVIMCSRFPFTAHSHFLCRVFWKGMRSTTCWKLWRAGLCGRRKASPPPERSHLTSLYCSGSGDLKDIGPEKLDVFLIIIKKQKNKNKWGVQLSLIPNSINFFFLFLFPLFEH